MAGCVTTKEGQNPLRCILSACYEAFGAKDAGIGINMSGDGVDGKDMRGFIIPGTIFPPIVCADLFP